MNPKDRFLENLGYDSSIDYEPLEKFVREEIIPGVKDRDAGDVFPIEIFQELGKLGWLHSYIPKEMGGLGLTSVQLCQYFRKIGFGSAGIATSSIANVLAAVPILHYGSEDLKKRVVADILENHSLLSFAFTEPDAGSDVFRIKTRAKRVSDGYLLKGQKCFITNGNFSTHYTIVAFLEGIDHPRKAATVFYVQKGTKGLSTGNPMMKLGHRESNTTELFLDDVFVPAEHRLGGEGQGLQVAFNSLQRSRTFFAASAMGVCDRANEITLDHLRKTHRFNGPLLDQPAIQHSLASHYPEQEACWLLTCAASHLWDTGVSRLTESSMAKSYSGKVAMSFVSKCLELCAGLGYSRDLEIERLFRDAKLFEIIEGPTLVQQAIISKELFRSEPSEKRNELKTAA